MKKCLLLLLVAALLLPLASCTGGGNGDATTAPSVGDAPTTEAPATDAPLDESLYVCISGGLYTLTRPDRCTDEELDVFRLLSRTLTELEGAQFKVGNDFMQYDAPPPENDPEILMGKTNRLSSIEATAALSEKSWAVKWNGAQLLIVGADTAALNRAAEAFLAEGVVKNGGKLYVPRDLSLSGSYALMDNSSLLPAIKPDSEVTLIKTSSDGEAYTPDWVRDLIIMEANLANATPEGTLESSKRVVDHVAQMGVNGLWITPVGDRVGAHFYGNRGPHTIDDSLTGCSNYDEGWQKFADFVSYAHSKNVRVILDIVTWGTAEDSDLYREHPDWYTGEDIWSGKEFDWSNPSLREWYIQTTVDMVMNTSIDGLRCDCEPDYAGYDIFREIRARLLARGKKILIISEHSNTRDGAFDLEQFGVFDYKTVSFSDQQDKKINWFLRDKSILAAIRRSEMIGQVQKEIQDGSAYYRFFSYCVSCHDFNGTAVKKDIAVLAYQALFAPFVPIWYLGEEFGWEAGGNILYQKVDWEAMNDPENLAFMELVKEMIAIRRTHADVFSVFNENHRESNICAVTASGFGTVPAYARYIDGKAVIVLPNRTGDPATGSVTVPLATLGLSATEIKVTDLITGKELTLDSTGTFTPTLAAGQMGVYLVEKR